MSRFRSFLHSQDVNQVRLWQKISNIVTLTLLTMAPSVPSSTNCLEMLGVDILVDSKFKPCKSSQKHPVFSWDQGTHDRTIPCHRVRDFILTFPFNEVTRKASQDSFDVRTIVHEVHKFMSQITSSHIRTDTRKNNRADLLETKSLLSDYYSSN
ncbi:probable tubulin polyglutamylase TTLL2 [Tachysurus ichikawai]